MKFKNNLYEDFYNSLGDYGKKLLKLYSDTLNIDINDSIKIMKTNKSAYIFITSESGLRLSNYEKNLSILIRCTIFREFNNFKPLNDIEIKRLEKYYGKIRMKCDE